MTRSRSTVRRSLCSAAVASLAVGPPAAGAVREEDVLERARREPAVKSFLDTFPGPVKAEKIKP